jgi:hypothetical protein
MIRGMAGSRVDAGALIVPLRCMPAIDRTAEAMALPGSDREHGQPA